MAFQNYCLFFLKQNKFCNRVKNFFYKKTSTFWVEVFYQNVCGLVRSGGFTFFFRSH